MRFYARSKKRYPASFKSAGLLDGVEDANGNGMVDQGETDPNDPDTDADGLDDGSEQPAFERHPYQHALGARKGIEL